ncbi:ubiquitin-conjugating enzyme E2 Q2-like [Clytia hemisphaerica]|uniref:UBC core domain-containing protein n=1 Tax=Clytia hemisphaerica TaxID=252671 RepID=A0A7M5X2G8_9CNID|eukprot:TCONS_00067128-protein
MSRRELKKEIEYLKTVFPKTQHVLRILSASTDDLTCSFTDNSGKKHTIICSITDSYPDFPPIWCSESEAPQLVEIVEKINAITSSNHLLFTMTKTLAIELFTMIKVEVPTSVLEATLVSDEKGVDEDYEMDEVDCDDEEENEIEDEDDDDDPIDQECFDFREDPVNDESKEKDEVGEANYSQLQKLRGVQREEYLSGKVSGSVQATDRLMKELKNIYKSDSFKKNLYTLELKEESNLYDWFVKLKGFDKESHLHKDLLKLFKSDSKTDHICLNLSYTSRFPMEPPFVRVCYPAITGGYVLNGGAICMELLTPQGWSSAYSIEALIMQISATLVKGKARVDFSSTNRINTVYSLNKAQQSYKTMVQIHEKSGWFTPPKDEG